MIEPIPMESEQVVVTEDGAWFQGFVEHDPEVLAVLAEAEDPAAAAPRCRGIGARAGRGASLSLDADVVERRFEEVAGRFDEQVGQVLEQIESTTSQLLDEEQGALGESLRSNREQFEALVSAAFDPDSKKSVMAIFEKVMAEGQDAHLERMRRLISLDGDQSPLSVLHRQIVNDVARQLDVLRQDVQAVAEKVAVDEKVGEVMEITTAKGFAFEEVVHAQLSSLAAAHGDLAEPVGEIAGATGGKVGDEIVTLNAEDTQGRDLRFVVEAKDRKLNMRTATQEIDEAMANRGGSAGIMVFRFAEQAPSSVPFQYSDNRAIVVLDEDGGEHALRLAYMWARWVVRRQLTITEEDGVDVARITGLIDDLRRSLDRTKSIKSQHTQAKNSIDKAGSQLTEMYDEIAEQIDRLEGELR